MTKRSIKAKSIHHHPISLIDYISGIKFKNFQPDIRLPKQLFRRYVYGKTAQIDMSNVKLPDSGKSFKQSFVKLLDCPKLSSFAIGALINYGVAKMDKGTVYVNVGVWHGYSFFAGMLNNPRKTCIGVDNFAIATDEGHSWLPEALKNARQYFYQKFELLKSRYHKFYEMDYREYFLKTHKEPIGFYFYDGHHAYEDQLQGLQIAEKFFAKNCIILIDDTNWPWPRKATFDFISKSKNLYQVLFDKRTHIVDGMSYHFPTFWNGIIVLQKLT